MTIRDDGYTRRSDETADHALMMTAARRDCGACIDLRGVRYSPLETAQRCGQRRNPGVHSLPPLSFPAQPHMYRMNMNKTNYTYIYIYIQKCKYINIYMRIYTQFKLYIYFIHIYIHTYIYIYIYRQRERYL